MDFMARNQDKRKDIRAWMPDAKSVLMAAFSYGDPQNPPASKPGHGRVARYAARPDYHDILRKKMTAVGRWLESAAPGARGVAFCDMSPLLERAYSRAAGLGWQGKNAMMIAPTLGSYFLLAGLAINIELPTDSATADHCGTCRRCLDECPTDAFPAERILDASRCIAYYTIESRTAAPEELRAKFGDWVFGCDVCQEVCPWNRFEKPARALPPAKIATEIPLEELAGPGSTNLRSKMKGTPVATAVRRRMTRNALIAMANSRDAKFEATLREHAANPDPDVSEVARWGLLQIKK